MNDEHIAFEALFKEKIAQHNLSFKKLSEATGIAVSHLENLCAGNYEKLPAAPYLRGYLIRLGTLLAIDGEAWWEALKKAGVLTGSGPEDALPKNRFARVSAARWLWIAALGIAAVLYLTLRFSSIVGKPSLVVLFPNEPTTTATSDTITLYGTVERANTLTVNGAPVKIQNDGTWEASVLLEPGSLNTVNLTAQKFLGGKTSVIRQIIYVPPALEMASSSPESSF